VVIWQLICGLRPHLAATEVWLLATSDLFPIRLKQNRYDTPKPCLGAGRVHRQAKNLIAENRSLINVLLGLREIGLCIGLKVQLREGTRPDFFRACVTE
jgi:hypothetical protein